MSFVILRKSKTKKKVKFFGWILIYIKSFLYTGFDGNSKKRKSFLRNRDTPLRERDAFPSCTKKVYKKNSFLSIINNIKINNYYSVLYLCHHVYNKWLKEWLVKINGKPYRNFPNLTEYLYVRHVILSNQSHSLLFTRVFFYNRFKSSKICTSFPLFLKRI